MDVDRIIWMNCIKKDVETRCYLGTCYVVMWY